MKVIDTEIIYLKYCSGEHLDSKAIILRKMFKKKKRHVVCCEHLKMGEWLLWDDF